MMNKRKWLVLAIVCIIALLIPIIIFASNSPWIRVNNRGVDPETGERFAPPWWEKQAEQEPSLLFSAISDWPVTGIDVSKWQGTMDWDTAKSRGITFAIIRASYYYGGLYEDSQYQRNIAECLRVELICGVYHYIVPSGSAATQANFFSDRYRGQLPAWLDVEDNGGLSTTALADWLQIFADTVESRTGKTPGIYTRATFWNSYVADRNWEKYKLWIARYDSVITNPYPPYVPRDWPLDHDWIFWQWSAGGNGLGAYYGAKSDSIDLNRFNGTQAEFDWLFGLEPKPEPTKFIIPAGRYQITTDAAGNVVFTPLSEVFLPIVSGD